MDRLPNDMLLLGNFVSLMTMIVIMIIMVHVRVEITERQHEKRIIVTFALVCAIISNIMFVMLAYYA